MQLKLYTPKPEQALQQAPETRAAAVAEWLKQLPKTPAEEGAQRLVAELGRLNRAELDEDLRAKLALLFEPVVRKWIETLLVTLPENGTPQSTLHRQAANLAYELALELAYAWKLVCLGIQERRSLFGGAKARQNALLHLLAALSGQISTSYRSYTSPPLHSWHELHQVHEAIREEGMGEAEAEAAGTPQRVNGLHLLSRLYQSWRGAVKRGFNRYEPELAHVDVVSGIPAIHRLFDPKQKPLPTSTEAKTGANGLADQGFPARWRVVNDSASGLAISAHAQEVAQVRMGNPLALREENSDAAAWTLGVIRWGKMSKGQMVVAGVEKLAPNAASVVLRFADGDSANIGQPALLIPANPALQTDERLLLPRGLYRRGRAAELWHDGERRRIGLGGLVEETAFFDLVEVEPA